MDNRADINPLYYADAAVGENDTPGRAELVCYQVNKRFVDNEYSIPKNEEQEMIEGVVYYALDIGHHTGIIDCFAERLRCPLSLADEIYKSLPEGTLLRRKLKRAVERGESYMNCDEVYQLISDAEYASDVLAKERQATDGEAHESAAVPEAAEGEEAREKDYPSYATDASGWLCAFTDMLKLMLTVPDASIIARRRM
ncbi:MAG: hypothetical protein LUB61_01295 [Eggerthellaceae bacterium]|nr:hypothetical protein [Eggerthellaceae bacterium]